MSFDAAFWLPRSPVDEGIVLGDGTPATTTVCLKGRREEFGPCLELPAAEGIVYVGRAQFQGGWRLPRSPFANPFTVKTAGSAQSAVQRFADWLPLQADLLGRLGELRGKRLGCWCAEGSPCHGVWLAAFVDRLTVGPAEAVAL